MKKEAYSFSDLIEIMNKLRSSEGCPWDIEQNHDSLKRYLIEETYEVLETIDAKDDKSLCEELGDLLLQIVFHSQIGKERNAFSIDDVITGICEKMINRHPHVFGEDKIESSKEVLQNWEDIKKKEKNIETQTQTLKRIPINLPSLMRAYKIQQKAADVGFDWDYVEDAFEKMHEEIKELKDVYKSKNMDKISEEVGDILFSVVNIARFLDIQPELALTNTNNKFIKRFEYVENGIKASGKKMEEASLSEMDCFWNKAKKN